MKEHIYYVSGMHCASCELLIERRLLKEPGVRAVDASLSNGTLRVEYEKHPPDVKKLNEWFQEDGYAFSREKQAQKKAKSGRIKTLAKVALVFFALFALERAGFARYISVSDQSSLGLFFVFGIVAGLSSCAALIGGILLSLTKGWNDRYGYDASAMKKMTPHFFFHGGRLFAYGVFGGMLGAIGKAASFDNATIYGVITILISLVMLMMGLQMAGVKWAARFQIRMPKFVSRRVAGDGQSASNRMPFAIGAGTVLLPCGFTLVAQGVALTSGSVVKGSLMMLMFVFGTMIPLLAISLAGVSGSRNPKRGRAFSFYAGIVLVIFALYNVNGQLNVLGLPSVSDAFAKDRGSEDEILWSPYAPTSQTVSLIAQGFSYTLTGPSTIVAGVPTTLIVNNRGVSGCGRYLAARGLVNGYAELRPGQNVIDLGKPRAGTYKITCSMGMVQPVTIRVQ